MGEVKVQSHNVSLTFYRLTSLSFHVNLASHCWVTTFSNFTLKFKGQDHRWGHSSKSQYGYDILSTHIPIVPCQSAFHSWDTAFSKFDLGNEGSRSWVRSQFKSQCGSSILSTHIPFVPCQSALPFLRYSIFKIWPWKSRVKVIGEVTVQSHNMGLTSYGLTSLSFHVNWPSHSWDTAFSKSDLENQGSRSNEHNVAQLQVKTIPYNFE